MRWMILAFLCVSNATFASTVDLSQTRISLEYEQRDLYFEERGWFSNTRYPIRYFNGIWHWQREGKWADLATPFVGKWDSKFRIILGRGGDIFLNSLDNAIQIELKWRNNEWQSRPSSSDQWSSMLEDSIEADLGRNGNGM